MIQQRTCPISSIRLRVLGSLADILKKACRRRSVLFIGGHRQEPLRVGYLVSLLFLALTTHSILAQEKSPEPLKKIETNIISLLSIQPQTPTPSQQRLITI